MAGVTVSIFLWTVERRPRPQRWWWGQSWIQPRPPSPPDWGSHTSAEAPCRWSRVRSNDQAQHCVLEPHLPPLEAPKLLRSSTVPSILTSAQQGLDAPALSSVHCRDPPPSGPASALPSPCQPLKFFPRLPFCPQGRSQSFTTFSLQNLFHKNCIPQLG